MKRYSNCMEVREEFSALLDDELTVDERDGIEGHLSECAECLRELDSLKRVDVLFSGLAPVNAPGDFEERVRRAARPRTLWFRRLAGGASMRWMQPVAVAAAMLIVVGGALFFVLNEPDTNRMQVAQLSEDEAFLDADTVPIVQRVLKAEGIVAAPPAEESVVTASRRDAGDRLDPAPATKDGAWAEFVQAPGELAEGKEQARNAPKKSVAALSVGSALGDVAQEPGRRSAASQLVNEEVALSSEDMDDLQALGYIDGATQVAAASPSIATEFRRERDEVLGEPERVGFTDMVSLEPEAVSPDDASNGRMNVLAQGKPIKTVKMKSYKIGSDGAWIQKGYADEATTPLKRGSDELRFLVTRYGGDISDIAQRPARCIFEIDGAWYDLEAEALEE